MGARFSVPTEGMNAIERAEFEKAEKQIHKIGSKAQKMTFYMMIMMGLYTYVVDKEPCLFTKGSSAIVLMGALMMVLINYQAFRSIKRVGQEMAAKNHGGSFWAYIRTELMMLLSISTTGLTFLYLCFWLVFTASGCAMSPLPPS